jgi:hypothetical protein
VSGPKDVRRVRDLSDRLNVRRVRDLSDRLLGLVHGQSLDVAIMSLIDVAVRLLRAADPTLTIVDACQTLGGFVASVGHAEAAAAVDKSRGQ